MEIEEMESNVELSSRELFKTPTHLPVFNSLQSEKLGESLCIYLRLKNCFGFLWGILRSSATELRESVGNFQTKFSDEIGEFEDELIRFVGCMKQYSAEAVSTLLLYAMHSRRRDIEVFPNKDSTNDLFDLSSRECGRGKTFFCSQDQNSNLSIICQGNLSDLSLFTFESKLTLKM